MLLLNIPFTLSAPVIYPPTPHRREAQYVTTLVKALSQRYPQSVYYTMRAFLLERREQPDRGSSASNVTDSNKLPKPMSLRLPGGSTVSQTPQTTQTCQIIKSILSVAVGLAAVTSAAGAWCCVFAGQLGVRMV